MTSASPEGPLFWAWCYYVHWCVFMSLMVCRTHWVTKSLLVSPGKMVRLTPPNPQDGQVQARSVAMALCMSLFRPWKSDHPCLLQFCQCMRSWHFGGSTAIRFKTTPPGMHAGLLESTVQPWHTHHHGAKGQERTCHNKVLIIGKRASFYIGYILTSWRSEGPQHQPIQAVAPASCIAYLYMLPAL